MFLLNPRLLPFSSPFLAFFKMARTKTTSNPPPNVDYKALNPWAFVELLTETSTLTSSEDVRKHRDEDSDPKGHVFGRESYAYVSVRPCAKGKQVCADDHAIAEEPFFFFLYSTIFKRIKLHLLLTGFERALLTEVNVARAQMHPNSWAFVRAFAILCNHFEAKSLGKKLWVSFNEVAGRVLLALF